MGNRGAHMTWSMLCVIPFYGRSWVPEILLKSKIAATQLMFVYYYVYRSLVTAVERSRRSNIVFGWLANGIMDTGEAFCKG